MSSRGNGDKMSRISILDKDKCQPKKCNYVCMHYCPGVRMEEDTIVIDEKSKKPLISEELCSGCGICTNRCPFGLFTVTAKMHLNSLVCQPLRMEPFLVCLVKTVSVSQPS